MEGLSLSFFNFGCTGSLFIVSTALVALRMSYLSFPARDQTLVLCIGR